MASMSRSRPLPRARLAYGALGIVALLAGLWAALLLLRLPVWRPEPDFAEIHGPLMVLGFLGTLIALERAVALGRRAGYAAPLASGAGGLALLLGLPLLVGQALLALAGLALLGVYVASSRLQASVHLAVMAAGAVAWVGAVLAWLAGRDFALVVPWLAGFLVFTIAGERLELARVARLTRKARLTFLAAAAVLAAGLVTSLVASVSGARVTGAGLLLLAGWLAVHDVTRRTVRQPGLTRYMAVCLLTGYAWLAISGALWLGFGTLEDGRPFDAMLHALFLGFVIGMVFAHAPVIVPAVFRRPLPYRPYFYGHYALLHASLVLRLLFGDLLGHGALWQAGGVLNEVALLLFLASSITAVRRARRGTGRRLDRGNHSQADRRTPAFRLAPTSSSGRS